MCDGRTCDGRTCGTIQRSCDSFTWWWDWILFCIRPVPIIISIHDHIVWDKPSQSLRTSHDVRQRRCDRARREFSSFSLLLGIVITYASWRLVRKDSEFATYHCEINTDYSLESGLKHWSRPYNSNDGYIVLRRGMVGSFLGAQRGGRFLDRDFGKVLKESWKCGLQKKYEWKIELSDQSNEILCNSSRIEILAAHGTRSGLQAELKVITKDDNDSSSVDGRNPKIMMRRPGSFAG
jgi:hypothetical protein